MFQTWCSFVFRPAVSRLTLLSAVVLASVALCPDANAGLAAPPLYTVTDLGTLPGYDASVATGLNDAGQVVANSYGASQNPYWRATLFAGGTASDVSGGIAGDTRATGINSGGQVVGNFNNGAFLYSKGTAYVLNGFRSAYGINNSGQILGSPGIAEMQANGVLQPVAPISSDQGGAINQLGQAAISSYISSSASAAYFYSNGTLEPLSGLPGGDSAAFAINDAGTVVGESTVPGNGTHAVLFTSGAAKDLGTLFGASGSSMASGINDSGVIVGDSVASHIVPHWGTVMPQAGFVYENGTMYDLNNLLASDGYLITSAAAINSSGQIAADAITPAGKTHAVLLTPTSVPLPSAAWAMLAVLPLLPLGRWACQRDRSPRPRAGYFFPSGCTGSTQACSFAPL